MPDRILIVDDDLDTLRLVGLMLKKLGYQVLSASSGQQGLELILSETPDLILLDVMMPGMDGLEVARRVKANEKTQNIPILMFSAKGELNDKVAGFEAGADDYLTKPTHPNDLQTHIKTLLGRFSKKVTSQLSKPAEEQVYTVGVISARGGLGVTTVAVNLAASLGKKVNGRVVLAEFRPGQGTLHYDLGIEKSNGLTELLHTPLDQITRDLVGEKLIRHQEGFKVLPASSRPMDAVLLQNVPQFEMILRQLKQFGTYVVVDLGCGLTSLNQKIISFLNELIIVVEPHENSLNHTQTLIDDLANLGMEKENLYVVVNYRIRSDTPLLSVVQIQTYFKAPIEVSLTPAPELYMQASRKNLVASLMSEESVTALQFSTLASKVESRAHQNIRV